MQLQKLITENNVLAYVVSNAEAQFEGKIIKFKLSAANLPSRDAGGTSDPFVKLFSAEGKSRRFDKFAESSIIDRNLNPIWADTFVYLYVAGKNQRWKFLVKDWDYSPDDHLGRTVEVKVEEYMNEIERNGGKPVFLLLTNPKGGILSITPVT